MDSELTSSTPGAAAVSLREPKVMMITAPRNAESRVARKRPGRLRMDRMARKNIAHTSVKELSSTRRSATRSPRWVMRSATASAVGAVRCPASRPSARKSTESA